VCPAAFFDMLNSRHERAQLIACNPSRSAHALLLVGCLQADRGVGTPQVNSSRLVGLIESSELLACSLVSGSCVEY
jgi:hypothetical protein